MTVNVPFDLTSFALAAVGLLASPGPGTLALAATGAAYGFRGSGRFLLGTMTGLTAAIILVAFGLFAIILAVPYARIALLSLSITYLAWLAFSIATARPIVLAQQTSPPSLLAGVMLGLTNPKAYAAFAALFAGFTLGHASIRNQVTKVILCVGVMVASELAWASIGNILRKPFAHPQWSRVLNVGFAAGMVVAVVWALWPH